MNVISRKKLQTFYKVRQHGKHAQAFEDWFKLARRAEWHTFQDVKATFAQTDVAKDTTSGRTATIFDVGGNKYRVIARISYVRQTLLITHVLTHAEYDKMKWKADL